MKTYIGDVEVTEKNKGEWQDKLKDVVKFDGETVRVRHAYRALAGRKKR